MEEENRFTEPAELRKENLQEEVQEGQNAGPGEAREESPWQNAGPGAAGEGHPQQEGPPGNGYASPPPGYGSQTQYGYANQIPQGYGNVYWQEPVKSESVGFGIASLVLGILSLLLFCTCINWLTGILAIIFGIVQIAQSSRKGLAVGGIVTAGLSMLFTVIFYIAMFFMGVGYSSYDDYYDYYDYYNDYYNDYYDDSYDPVQEEFL